MVTTQTKKKKKKKKHSQSQSGEGSHGSARSWNQYPNDPKKVDSFIGWIILIGFGGVVFLALCQNIAPYSSLITNLVDGFWLFRWVRPLARVAGFILGTFTLAAVQASEVWPLLLLDTPAEERNEEWNRKMRVACTVASGGYALDALACANFWPPLKVAFATFRYAPTWGAIAWGNIAIALFTLFGLAAYVWLWRYIRKVM